LERVWASERVVKKAGFVFEERMRRAACKSGVVMDELRY
jgi:RimJ/RimL family protein N-acetyltransferase